MALSRLKADDSQGTATAKIDYENRKTTSRFYGCIVKNDENLKSLIQSHIKSSADKEMFSKTKHFFYTCDPKFEKTIITNSTTSLTVTCPRFTKPDNPKKGCKQIFSLNDFVKVQEHIFVPCDFENFNESKYFNDYSKTLREAQTLNETDTNFKIELLTKEQDILRFLQIRLTVNGQSFKVSAEDYENLVDAGPVLKDGTLVGGFEKKENNEIFISIFDGGFPGRETGQAAGTQTDPGQGTGQTAGTQASTSVGGTGQAAGTQASTPGRGTGQAGGTQASTSRSVGGTGQRSDLINQPHHPQVINGQPAALPRLNHGAALNGWKQYFPDKGEPKPLLNGTVGDRICERQQHVDYSPGFLGSMGSWMIPEIDPKPVPEEEVLLREHIVAVIQMGLSGRLQISWKQVAIMLGAPEIIRAQLYSNDPAERLFYYVNNMKNYHQVTEEWLRKMITVAKGPKLMDVIISRIIYDHEKNVSSAKDSIPPRSEKKRRVNCLDLNEEVNGLPIWNHLARCWNISNEISSQKSPAEMLLKDWLIVERPDFTVKELCHILGEIGCKEGKEVLERKLQEWCN